MTYIIPIHEIILNSVRKSWDKYKKRRESIKIREIIRTRLIASGYSEREADKVLDAIERGEIKLPNSNFDT